MSTVPGPTAPSFNLIRSTAALARDDPPRREGLGEGATAKPSNLAEWRARNSGKLGWAPIAGALAIDLADLISAGPHGLVIGGVLTMIVALTCGVRFSRALLLGLLGAVYCALPLTEPIPLATMLTLLYGFLLRMRAAAQPPSAT